MTSDRQSPAVQPTRVVVATTVLLSFISFWRAAAIVLGDMGSSAFYAGGIAEQAVGKAAPWFILGVMLFAWVVRAIYIESSVMFVRGGVYRVVKEAMGGTLAKLSVSALLFDYVLTGPISAVSAGLYIAGLIGDVLAHYHMALPVPRDLLAAGFAIVVIVYFWWRNTQGMHESSSDALHIIQITTVMVVILFAWAFVTLLLRQGAPLPPLPSVENLSFSEDALGWLKDTRFPTFTAIALVIGFGHSFLAMSGYESLAQVYREIESPKALNLRRTALVVFVYSVLFTGAVSFLATAFIPDNVRPHFYDNMISGIAMHLAGPQVLRLGFQAFVVVVGFLILASAVNTAIVGSNAVLNRVSEDGVLPEWFREPHRKYGTTYRFLNLIVVLQLLTVVLSGGHIYILGEAYAFGVVWSFALKALAVLVLRFKSPGPREWRVPGNLKIGTIELPIGLAGITLALFTVAIVNLFTKEVATISGSIFTVVIYTAFVISERATHRRRLAEAAGEHVERLIRDVRDGTFTPPGEVPDAVRRAMRFRPAPALAKRLQGLAKADGRLLPRHFWRLAFLGNWTGGTLKLYLPRLRELYGDVPVRDIGLLASEGRFTVPLADGSPAGVAEITDNFLEFIPAEQRERERPDVFRAHELEEFREYFLIFSNWTGLFRYDLDDRVRVTGRLGRSPVLEFLSRGANTAIITGEKITEHHVVEEMRRAGEKLGTRVERFVVQGRFAALPCYELRLESADATAAAALAEALDEALAELNMEYRSKRKSDRLEIGRAHV